MRQQSINIALSFHSPSATPVFDLTFEPCRKPKEVQPQGLVTPDNTDNGHNENGDGNEDDIKEQEFVVMTVTPRKPHQKS